ncbi:MAG: hypothetical protein QOG65_2390 [Actinomycetota bacterium]|jgi:hypothetical protein|nr:hypothetical protein [Actinomycetota bacterium]
MERHPTDFVELLFGLAFLAAGGAFIVRQTTDRSFDGAWIAAIALVTIGSAFLVVTVLRRPRPELGNERPIEIPVDEPVEEVRP